MVRTVNEVAYEARCNAILDAAKLAVETTGYEQMAIADILGELRISSGAFYHYFDSKPALLSALVERMEENIEQSVFPIIHDPKLGALAKLQRFVLASLRVWYDDENAIVAASADALERVLGAPASCPQHSWREDLEPWLFPPSGKKEEPEP